MEPADFAPAEIDPMTLPPHGSEVFMGNVDRNATHDQIREFASGAGEVYSVKMMPDPTNPAQNKGYVFVTYVTKESALRAMDHLHLTEMASFPGKKVRVQPSTANNKLFVGGLPHSMDETRLREALESLGLQGIISIDLARSKDVPDGNRGFAFLEFYNAAVALQAKSKLSLPDVRIGDRTINVDVAEPASRDQTSSGASKHIFVGNLPAAVTEDQLRTAFSSYGEIEKIHIPRQREGDNAHKGYGFVHFTERLAAAHAVDAEQKPEIEGAQLVVKYGRSDGTQQQAQHGGRIGSGAGMYGGGAQQYHQQPYGGGYQQPYGGMGMGMPGMVGGMGGVVPMVPVQLPNGQMGYMLQPGAMMGDGGMGGGMGMGGPMRSRGGYRGGRGGGGRGGGYGGGGGYRGGRGGGGATGQRYHPY